MIRGHFQSRFNKLFLLSEVSISYLPPTRDLIPNNFLGKIENFYVILGMKCALTKVMIIFVMKNIRMTMKLELATKIL